ncbi:hypothetical protein GCM10010358_49260 [Streptomyces minutiscleroticus]|uniref:OAA-family lectin sugar binding domain-containing protein n=1 Tax=Streptomyces minutiscleroticus TaxID=68238 RepID=A0A918NRP2_9ACTN|nr:alpha-1,2-mannosidase [Streptomyces minutiscleroticus]GGX89464.1 hypothetical protein GCM10010358_49260 [Streptomyces minutiscleroticus]
MEPTYADFTVSPARLSNAVVRHHRCAVAPTHVAVGAGGTLKADFTVPEADRGADLTLSVTAVGPVPPTTVLLNGKVVTEDLSFAGDAGRDAPRELVVALPGALLTEDGGLLEIRTSADADDVLRLLSLGIDAAGDSGAARRAMAARAAARSVLAFAVEQRTPGADRWQPAPRLLLHMDCGEHADPAQLSWRGTDGSEASVAFRAGTGGFHGHRRAADGNTFELRGTLAERHTYPDGVAGAAVRQFTTEESHGGSWRPADRLRVLLDDGGAAVERLERRDVRGGAVSLAFRPAAAPALPEAVPGAALREVTRDVAEVEASDEFAAAGETADNLLRSSRSKWLVHDEEARLDFAFDRPTAVAAYALTAANDFPDRDPRDWELQGSTDGSRWTVLDVRSGEHFGRRFARKEYSFANSTPYRFYRLLITDNAGGTEIQLSRVQFFEADAAAAATAAVCDFVGFRHRPGQDPVALRGTAVPGPPQGGDAEEPTEKILPGDLRDAARSLDTAARLMGKLAQYL